MSPHHYCLYNDQVLGIGWRREAVLGEVATPAWTVDTSNPYIAMSYIYQYFIQVHFKLHLPLHPSVWLHYIDYLLYIIHFTLSYNMFIHNLCALHNSLSPKSGTSGKLGLHFFPNCCHCIRERKLSWAQTWPAPEISWLFSVPKSLFSSVSRQSLHQISQKAMLIVHFIMLPQFTLGKQWTFV